MWVYLWVITFTVSPDNADPPSHNVIDPSQNIVSVLSLGAQSVCGTWILWVQHVSGHACAEIDVRPGHSKPWILFRMRQTPAVTQCLTPVCVCVSVPHCWRLACWPRIHPVCVSLQSLHVFSVWARDSSFSISKFPHMAPAVVVIMLTHSQTHNYLLIFIWSIWTSVRALKTFSSGPRNFLTAHRQSDILLRPRLHSFRWLKGTIMGCLLSRRQTVCLPHEALWVILV